MDEQSLLRRPWIDRRGAADAENILQHPGAGQQLCLAARRCRAYAQQAALLAVMGEDLPAFFEHPLAKEQ